MSEKKEFCLYYAYFRVKSEWEREFSLNEPEPPLYPTLASPLVKFWIMPMRRFFVLKDWTIQSFSDPSLFMKYYIPRTYLFGRWRCFMSNRMRRVWKEKNLTWMNEFQCLTYFLYRLDVNIMIRENAKDLLSSSFLKSCTKILLLNSLYPSSFSS